MSNYIGIRHENKYTTERRVPLSPKQIDYLIHNHKLDFVIQRSAKRIFKDQEYEVTGAELSDNLNKCDVIFGVKEIPVENLEAEKTYIFFSHVIKGQPHNIAMLKRLKELKCNLIDYEKIVDDQGKRIIFFGKYAGLAGMITTLWALGKRLEYNGIKTPFLNIRQAHDYKTLKEAKDAISETGQQIAEQGLPAEISPLTIGITGYGNVASGVLEILRLLPMKEISPEELLLLKNREKLPNNLMYKVIFKAEHISEHNDGLSDFDMTEYYANPQNYHNVFEQYAPHLSVIMNCMYWDNRFPRIITLDFLKQHWTENSSPKLVVIGDISCDLDGSIECTYKGTEPDNPVYVYNPLNGEYSDGFEGEGILDMAIDILPSQLPRDASEEFGEKLVKFVKPIAFADFNQSFEDVELPRSIKKGLILHKGEFTPEFKYLEQYL
jgi:alanine dehydrogenase